MVLSQLQYEELKNYCNIPDKYQLIDFLGAGLGTFFIINNARQMYKDTQRGDKISGWNFVGLGLGSVMLYIHTARFFWAEEIKSGKRKV